MSVPPRGSQYCHESRWADGTAQPYVDLLRLPLLHTLPPAATQPPPCPFSWPESKSSLTMTCWPSLLGLRVLLIFSHKSFCPSGGKESLPQLPPRPL